MVGSCRLTGQPHSPLFFSGLHDFSVEILNRLRCVLALHGNMEKFWNFFFSPAKWRWGPLLEV
jgi:hypothetical protein